MGQGCENKIIKRRGFFINERATAFLYHFDLTTVNVKNSQKTIDKIKTMVYNIQHSILCRISGIPASTVALAYRFLKIGKLFLSLFKK